MGAFSTVINLFENLGPDFVGNLQTKDFDCIYDTYLITKDGSTYRICCPLFIGGRGAVRPYLMSGGIKVINKNLQEKYICLIEGRLIWPCC
jgi:hypothetical protein